MVRKLQRSRVNVCEKTKAPFSDAHNLAQAQLERFRRRLGTLTLEQELQIENLLISTVTRVSLLASKMMAALAESAKGNEDRNDGVRMPHRRTSGIFQARISSMKSFSRLRSIY